MPSFYKYSSNGNDFIFIDDRNNHFPSSNKKLIQKLCNRNFSIGADGVVLIKNSLTSDYKMKIFNSDGSEADMCGNALLSFGAFLYEHIEKKEKFVVETNVYNYPVEILGENVSFYSNYPKIIKEKEKIFLLDEMVDIHLINSGVSHGVMFLKDVDKIDVYTHGKKIRHLKNLSLKGINVNFCEMQKNSEIFVRTYEKGVEKETLCCSTAALAVAKMYNFMDGDKKNLVLLFRGGKIFINFEKNNIKLTGKPIFAFRGTIDSFA